MLDRPLADFSLRLAWLLLWAAVGSPRCNGKFGIDFQLVIGGIEGALEQTTVVLVDMKGAVQQSSALKRVLIQPLVTHALQARANELHEQYTYIREHLKRTYASYIKMYKTHTHANTHTTHARTQTHTRTRAKRTHVRKHTHTHIPHRNNIHAHTHVPHRNSIHAISINSFKND